MNTREILENQNHPEWLPQRMILLAKTGSNLYGTSLTPEEDPENKGSDIDYRGICIPPKEYYLGLNRFSCFDTTGGKNFKSSYGTTDISIMHITKFVLDAMQGVPNNLELLFLEKDNYEFINGFGLALRLHRFDFLNKDAIKRKFGGYASSQKKAMVLRTTRKELVEKFGYDVKSCMHACRLLLSATEILQTGNMSLPYKEAEWLKEIRKGKYDLIEAEKIIDDLDEKMNRAYEKSELLSIPNYNKINQWLIRINEEALSKNW